MIDVVFLLLIFFVWASSFDEPEFDLPGAISVPPEGNTEQSVESQQVEAFDEIIVRLIDQSGTVRMTLNGDTVGNDEELALRLTQILALGVQPPIIIDPDPTITMERTVAVYDISRNSGGDRVLFAARSDAQP